MSEKARAVGVSFPPALHTRVVERAARSYGGNVSAYIQRLTLADLDNKLAALDHDPEVIGNLARTYAGYFAPNLSRILADQKPDQPALLHHLLFELCELGASGYTLIKSKLSPDPAEYAAHLPAKDPAPYTAQKAAAVVHAAGTAALTKAIAKKNGNGPRPPAPPTAPPPSPVGSSTASRP
jgi:hypothetical protein